MTVRAISLSDAEADLEALVIEVAARGVEYLILRNGRPVVSLSPVLPPPAEKSEPPAVDPSESLL